MVLRATLVSVDDDAIGVLTSVLSEFGVAAQSCGYSSGTFYVPEYKLDALVVDFDDADRAISIVQSTRGVPVPPLVVAILTNQDSLRDAFAAGASFALFKPLSEDQARATLRAVIALIKRERRRCLRIPLQAPVLLEGEDGSEKEGVILDLSEDGLDLLTPAPIRPFSKPVVRFTLPLNRRRVEVRGEIRWANQSGQSGMRFVDMSEELRNTFVEFIDKHSPPELPAEEPWLDSECKLTDLSLAACYVETVSPFPERSVVELCLAVNEIEVHVEGTVRVMHPGVGMGIEFASRTEAQRDQVQNLLNLLTSCPGTLPKLTVAPRALCGAENRESDMLDDALLQLLRNHESFSQEEFLRELQLQRTSPEPAVV
ncbi:MAG: PilZ domain-containing protein [Terriglobales bacterium]